MLLSEKQKEFLKYKAKVETAEGQTYGGKTTIGAIKFILRVKASKKFQHAICALDLGTIEKNIINKMPLGILDYFGDEVEYNGNGNKADKLPHLKVKSIHGTKTVYLFGYADASRWLKALGGQYGCVMIDEANVADLDFMHEIMMRCDYALLTLNPDNPDLPVYKEYINHCRPLPKYEKDLPEEMKKQLYSEEAKNGWVHWYFRMDDNPVLTAEKKAQIMENTPKGTKQWKSKILGLRGRAEGLVFPEFDDNKIMSLDAGIKQIENEGMYYIYVGIDSGISPGKDATAVTMTLQTARGKLIQLPSFYKIPKQGENSNSQVALVIERWLDYWLYALKCFNLSRINIVGDSAALTQDLLLEISLRTKYDATKVESKDIIRDTQRLKSIIGTPNYWMCINAGHRNPDNPNEIIGDYDPLILELNNKVWDKKTGKPEDGNDHCIDALKYSSYYFYYGGM